MSIPTSLAAALAFALVMTTAQAEESQDAMRGFAPLLGSWRCDGQFVSSGKAISSHMVISRETASGSMLIRRDDEAPNSFHDLELWGPWKSGYRAAMADGFSGVRQLTSEGWKDGSLDWVRIEAQAPVERFRYTLLGGGDFKVDWFLADKSGSFHLGDSVQCRPA